MEVTVHSIIPMDTVSEVSEVKKSQSFCSNGYRRGWWEMVRGCVTLPKNRLTTKDPCKAKAAMLTAKYIHRSAGIKKEAREKGRY